VSEHRGHRITDKDESGGAAASSQQIFTRKSQILAKKIDASTGETSMFEEELNEIAEQLRVGSFYPNSWRFLFCLELERVDTF
jgi:hypothetical protein